MRLKRIVEVTPDEEIVKSQKTGIMFERMYECECSKKYVQTHSCVPVYSLCPTPEMVNDFDLCSLRLIFVTFS